NRPWSAHRTSRRPGRRGAGPADAPPGSRSRQRHRRIPSRTERAFLRAWLTRAASPRGGAGILQAQTLQNGRFHRVAVIAAESGALALGMHGSRARRRPEDVMTHPEVTPEAAPSRVTAVAAFVLSCLTLAAGAGAAPPPDPDPTAVRPFQIRIPEDQLADLRRRIAATRWPDKETVADPSQGVPLDKLKELVEYWGSGYDWRKGETKSNALPQFITTIDGVDIHFIHVRSRHKNALALIVTHGWPGSVIEQLKIIGPLTDPAAHGGAAGGAFDVVIPSVPGYCFSAPPPGTCW